MKKITPLLYFSLGQDRHLSTVDYQQLKNKAHEALPAKTATITLRPINGVQGCTVFDSALTREGTCIVVAMPTKVAVLKYSSSTGEFNVRKVGGSDEDNLLYLQDILTQFVLCSSR